MFRKIIYVILIIIISGVSGILADRYLFPYLSATDLFNKYKFLKKTAENVTVINKTEQVYVQEDTTVTKIAGDVSSSVVNIISYSDNQIKNLLNKNAGAAIRNGTGLIATSDGIIMTYASVINTDNAKYKVMVFDGNVYDADLIGVDSFSNLAFLKINASNLPTISFGNSDDFKAGEKIIALGNSLGTYQILYASGILDAYDPYFNLAGKTISSSEKLEGAFKANIDNEDSYVGGPIIDYSGQVIGISGSLNQDSKPVYFQLPSNKVKNVLDRAIKKELDQNCQLGLYYVPISRSYALANGLPEDHGALVYSPTGQQGLAIISGSPAAKAGIKLNDIITHVAGEAIDEVHSLSDLLYKHKKGEMIELTVKRDGQEIKIPVQF